jgi:hypothetical protein
MAEQTETISVPVEVKPPKYQITVPKNVRRVLDVEGKEAILDAEFEVRKVISDGGDGSE